MRTFSQFASYFEAHKNALPQSAARAIRLAAIARVKARWAEGRADSVLDFTDLVEAIETGIAPRA